jgi:hypothetical protein
MRLRAIYIAVEEHHEVRGYFVYIGRIFGDNRHCVAYVYGDWRQELVVAP